MLFLKIDPPTLLDVDKEIRILEGDRGYNEHFEIGEPPYPPVSTFEWTKDRNPVANDTNRALFGYPDVRISTVERQDSGVYTLTASNYFLEDPSQVVGIGVGMFVLEVYCKEYTA